MRLFWELTQRAFRRELTYRTSVLAGLGTNYFFGLFRIAVLLALYGDQEVVAGVTVQGGITYMVLIQAVIGYTSMFRWLNMMQAIYTGEIATDLLKPMQLYVYWLANDLGRASVQFFARGVFIVLLYLPFFQLQFPATLQQWIGLFITVTFSWVISFSWRYLINLAAFWTPNAVGIGRFLFIFSWFFSGFLMPLQYYPDWVVQIANFTPFPSMINVVMDTFIGVLQGEKLLQAILIQLGWTVGLILAGQITLKAGIKRLVIQGG